MSSNGDEVATIETPSPSSEIEGAAPPAPDVQISDELNHESNVEKEEVVTAATLEDPPTISPMDPSPSVATAATRAGLQLPSHPTRKSNEDDDGGVSLETWSEWDSIADNASKSSSSTRATMLSSTNVTASVVASPQGKRDVTKKTIYEDEGDLPSLSGRRNCEPPDANTFQQQQHQLRNATANDPPEYGYRKKAHHTPTLSTGIHNIQMNSRGHVYLDGEESVANSSNGPPGNLATTINNNNNYYEDDNETTTSSTNSPPPPSDYFNQRPHRQMYPAEPRGGAVDVVSGYYHEESSSLVGSSEATSVASNTTRSSAATVNTGSRGGSGEYRDGNVNSALDRHFSKGSIGTNGSNNNSRRKQDPQDYTDMIRKQDPQVSDHPTQGYGNAYSSRQASRRAHNFDAVEREEEVEPFIARQQRQQRVVYASSAKRDLYNHDRNGYPDKAKDSDLESGRASHQQHQQRVRFADKMFSSRENTYSAASSSHPVVVGNAPSSTSASAYGLSWRDRSISSDNSSVASKSSIDSQSSNSSISNRSRGSSNGSNRGGVGRNVVSLLANGLRNIFEGLQSTASAPTSNNSTSSRNSSGGGTRSNNNNRFQYLKRNAAILAVLSLMMLVTIGSYSGAFFGASANANNADSARGLGIEHDMRPPAMGLMDNVPHQAMLKGSVGAGMNSNGAGNNIMGGSGGLPPLVENGKVVDWDKVPPHLRGYYSKVFGVQGGGNAGLQQQQQQQQQQAMMQNNQQMQVQQDDPNAAAQAIQSIGNEAIGAEGSFKVPTLEQHEFQQHIQEIEGAVPFLGQQQQQEQMQQQQERQQQQEQQELNKEEMAKQQLEEVHQRQQAEAEQQRTQAEADQQLQQQQEEQQPKESSLPSPEEIDAAHEENVEEERRKPVEEEALEKVLQTYGAQEELQQESIRNEEKTKQQRDESEAAAAQNGEANNVNEVNTNAMDQGNSGAEKGVPVPESAAATGQNEAEGENATLELESLQSELSELMDMVKMQQTSDKG